MSPGANGLAGIIPTFIRPGMMTPGEFGPITAAPLAAAVSSSSSVSRTGTCSGIATRSFMPAFKGLFCRRQKAPCGHEHGRYLGAGRLDGAGYRVVHGYAVKVAAALARRHAGGHVGPVLDHEPRVVRPELAGNALYDDRLFVRVAAPEQRVDVRGVRAAASAARHLRPTPTTAAPMASSTVSNILVRVPSSICSCAIGLGPAQPGEHGQVNDPVVVRLCKGACQRSSSLQCRRTG